MQENPFPERGLWGGLASSLDAEGVARDAVALHEDCQLWRSAQSRGAELRSVLFGRSNNLLGVRHAVDAHLDRLNESRSTDAVGAMLWHHSARSTEFFSRWIEVKEIHAASQKDPRHKAPPCP